jgi:hypothetical protein
VELNLNGSVQVFSPPSGFTASGDVWGVFEIVVSSTGSATVNTLNTVSHSVSASAVSSERDLGTSAKLPMTADEEARF